MSGHATPASRAGDDCPHLQDQMQVWPPVTLHLTIATATIAAKKSTNPATTPAALVPTPFPGRDPRRYWGCLTILR